MPNGWKNVEAVPTPLAAPEVRFLPAIVVTNPGTQAGDGDGAREADTDTERDREAVLVCVDPNDWLGELDGDRDGETLVVNDGGTQELRMTEPAPPAAPAAPPPAKVNAEKAARGQLRLTKLLPPPPLPGV